MPVNPLPPGPKCGERKEHLHAGVAVEFVLAEQPGVEHAAGYCEWPSDWVFKDIERDADEGQRYRDQFEPAGLGAPGGKCWF